MAQCQKQATVYTATGTASNSTHVATEVWVPDTTTALASCQYLTVTAVEYQDLQHGYIATQADAEQIAFALVTVMAIAYGIKMIRKALDVGDTPSDEKH